MRALWNALETIDRTMFAVLDRSDRWLGRGELLARTRKVTAEVKEPQRIITFDT